MHKMRTISIDDFGVCLSVCLSHGFTQLCCANTAERIGAPRNSVLEGGGPNPPTTREEKFDAAFAKLLWPLFVLLLTHIVTWAEPET